MYRSVFADRSDPPAPESLWPAPRALPDVSKPVTEHVDATVPQFGGSCGIINVVSDDRLVQRLAFHITEHAPPAKVTRRLQRGGQPVVSTARTEADHPSVPQRALSITTAGRRAAASLNPPVAAISPRRSPASQRHCD